MWTQDIKYRDDRYILRFNLNSNIKYFLYINVASTWRTKLTRVTSSQAPASYNLLRDNTTSFDIIALYFRCWNAAHILSTLTFIRNIADNSFSND